MGKIGMSLLITLITSYGVGTLWQILEVLFYGRIESRVVDDIIMIIIMVILFFAVYFGISYFDD